MKILITDILRGNGGGHRTYVLSLLKGLKSRHDITLAVPPTGRLYKSAVSENGVRVLPGRYTSRPVSLIKEVLQLRKLLKKERFDVVHVNGSADHRHIMLASLGLPKQPAIVWTKHNIKPATSVGHRMRARFGTHAAIAVCDYVAGILDQSSYRHRPIRMVRLGVDPAYFHPIEPAERQAFRQQFFGPLEDDVLVLGSIGGTDFEKGWLDLVQAVSRLAPESRRRVRVLVAGDPPPAAMLAKVASVNMQDQVVFPGLLSDVRGVLGASDAGFVLSYQEAGSYASIETMSMGLPALVSNVGGLPENVRNGQDGWVVPAGDIDAMTVVLQDMLRNPEELVTLGRSARQRVVQEFSEAALVENTENVYGQAYRLAHHPSSPLSSSSAN